MKESLVPLLQQILAGSGRRPHGHFDSMIVKFLKRVLQGGAVNFRKDVGADLDLVIRPDPEDVDVEGGVVDPAHRDPVGDDGRTAKRVILNVGRVPQLDVLQPTERTPETVFQQHARPEDHGRASERAACTVRILSAAES